MNKKLIGILTLALCLCGCGSQSEKKEEPEPDASAGTEAVPAAADLSEYSGLFDSLQKADSWTAGVSLNYRMEFSDGSLGIYQMDGVLEMQDESTDAKAHVTQNIYSDGPASEIEGYYTGGRLYNTYNTVDYYEDMTADNVKEMMLVPLMPVKIRASQIDSFSCEETADSTAFIFELNKSGAEAMLLNRYDIYGLKEYEDIEVTSGKIVQTFDSNGHLAGETAEFLSSLSMDGIGISIQTKSSCGFVKYNETEVGITDEMKQNFGTYVNYTDIDTDAVSDADITSDIAEDTVTATLKKRLVGRLGYEETETGIYRTEYNDGESYTVDFNSSTFTYARHTSRYVYNWKGDAGGFGSTCSYDFGKNIYTDGCDDTVVEMMHTVKDFFVMELYYCGLSLDDLQAESQGG
ncbi:MAG: hypothetical protein K6D03_08565 [Solobacterium sp.]|nr:hypothetical protein [Solobacterium sp.]